MSRNAGRVQRFVMADARLQLAPGQSGEVRLGDVVDQRDGSPFFVGFGRYGPGESNSETLQFHEVMVVLSGELSVTDRTAP